MREEFESSDDWTDKNSEEATIFEWIVSAFAVWTTILILAYLLVGTRS